jgi:hypothetical protein
MNYQERVISKENLEKFLMFLDSDEGIRIDNESSHIFINKTSKRYCINTSNECKDGFFYKDTVEEVMSFLRNQITQTSKIFSY